MPDDGREVVAKAYVIGGDREPNAFELLTKADQAGVPDPQEAGYHFGAFRIDVQEPPYDPNLLCKIFENSNSLRQCVDAYKTNIDGFGHIFEPLIELRESGGRETVRDAIYLERAQAAQDGGQISLLDLIPPSDAEVEKKIEVIQYAMRIEKARVESFFENCCADSSFVTLRRNTREDLEVTGNAYWEIIRNDAGIVSQFAQMPSRSVRVTKHKSNMLDVRQHVRVGTLLWREETFRRRFRRYAQVAGEDIVYFKEYGDPSIVSSRSCKSYATLEDMLTAEGPVAPANEVFHFKVPSIRNGNYGVPRWIGNLLSVLGSRSAEEVNFAYFENKSIPPMAILVSGGRLGPESVKRIEDFVEINIKGKKNFHKILVIEAETSAGQIGLMDNASAMRLEIKILTDAQLKDGLFREYDAANMDKVGMGFRLPKLLRGDIKDFNRATASSSLDFAETQVFVPERNDFDFSMTRFFLTALGIRHYRFKSNGPRLSDSQDWGDMIFKLTTAGILTPEDARELAGKKVLSRELPIVDADWVKQPLALTIAGVQADTGVDNIIPHEGGTQNPDGGIPGSADPANLAVPPGGTVVAHPALAAATPHPSLIAAAKRKLLGKARELVRLRDALHKVEGQDAVAEYQKQRKVEEASDAALIFKMTSTEMAQKFGIIPE